MKINDLTPLIELEIEEVFEHENGGADPVDPTRDYEKLAKKPSINGVTLIGDKTLEEIGIAEISNTEIEEIIKSMGGL